MARYQGDGIAECLALLHLILDRLPDRPSDIGRAEAVVDGRESAVRESIADGLVRRSALFEAHADVAGGVPGDWVGIAESMRLLADDIRKGRL